MGWCGQISSLSQMGLIFNDCAAQEAFTLQPQRVATPPQPRSLALASSWLF